MSSARVPLVVPGTNPALATLEQTIARARGHISPLYQALLNSAPIAAGWEAMLTAVRLKTSLEPALRELVILRVAVLNRAPFEFEAHLPYAREAGLSDEKIEGVQAAPSAPPFDARELATLAFTDAMTRYVDVPDEVFEPVGRSFDATSLVELTATIAAYNMVSRFLVALRIGFPDAEHVR
jgi:4-carboxymuconolactone decarboxylase